MRIAHLADIQIRAHSRHEEYKKAFDNLYFSLAQEKPDRIVLAGDIVHNKVHISPELVDLCSSLFRNLAGFAPVDLILGNHDLSMNNMSKMDALTPIVNALDLPNFFFYRESGIYEFANGFKYVVYSCIDEQNWPMVPETNDVYIALFHGTIANSIAENGQPLPSHYSLSMFENCDYGMLGDIHKTQVLDAEKRFAYPGSYPKQSYGESLHGGYYIWDIESKKKHTLKFIELPSVCPFYTIELPDDLSVPKDLQLQEHARVRLRCRPLNAAEKKQIHDECVAKFTPVELRIVDDLGEAKGEIVLDNNEKISDLRSLHVQERLLADFLASYNVEDDVFDHIVKINALYNKHAENPDDTLRNVRFQLRKLSFGNVFSFGEKNELDFGKLKGLVGVLGPNAVGKSSLVVDIPLLGLFNTVAKDVSKNGHCINSSKNDATVALDVTLANQEYRLCRTLKLQKNGKSVTDLEFLRIQGSEQTDLRGLERGETDKAVRRIFGTPDDFLLTAVAPQFDLLGFVRAKATERKRLIGRYFDLDFFAEKGSAAAEELRALKREVQQYANVNFEAEIVANQISIDDAEEKKQKIQAQLNEISEQKAQIDQEIWGLDKGLSLAKTYLPDAIKAKAAFEAASKRAELARKDLAQLAKAGCLANPDCCLRSQQSALQTRLTAAEKEMEELLSKVNEMSARVQQAKDETQETRAKLASQKQSAERMIASYSSELKAIERQIFTLESEITKFRADREKYEKLKKEYQAYHFYNIAMGKDGIAHQIVTKNLAIVNREIARILSGDLDFEIWLEGDDKAIEVWFRDARGHQRQIELCSGMERTIAAIAIRAALISVTTLPVSNMFVLDEPFTSLDAEHLNAVGKLLNNLKRIFETIVIISHDDQIKDLCDSVIFVQRNAEGYSEIVY